MKYQRNQPKAKWRNISSKAVMALENQRNGVISRISVMKTHQRGVIISQWKKAMKANGEIIGVEIMAK